MRRIINQQVSRFFPKTKQASFGGDFKHLVCLLEYGSDGNSGSMHAQSSKLADFKRKYNLTNTEFRHLTELLGTDHQTLRHLFAGRSKQYTEIMEKRLRPFDTSSELSIEGKLA